MKRTRKQIQVAMDDHLTRCLTCRRWFRDDDGVFDPCSTMQSLHDEYDRT